MTPAQRAASVFELVAVRGPLLIQDGGRTGAMHQGIPPGGALVPELLARANRAVGNAWHAAALECYAGLALRLLEGAHEVATDDGVVRTLRPGDVVPFDAPTRRDRSVAYVAFASGGIDVPIVLGGRGTLLVAAIGGGSGRPLRRGDRLSVPRCNDATTRTTAFPRLDSNEAAVRIVAGPAADRATLEALTTTTFTLAAARDRVGLRLDGAAPWPTTRASERTPTAPMVRGAIELPPSGQPIVLGPDHPTTGGYPVVAVVARADLGRLFARPVGARVRFELATVDDARAAWAAHAAAWFDHPGR